MLTKEDFQNILALLSSDRLTVNGREARTVALLQQKIEDMLNDTARSTEDSEAGGTGAD